MKKYEIIIKKNNIILYCDIIFFSLFTPTSLYLAENFNWENWVTQLTMSCLIFYYLIHILFNKQDFMHNLHHCVVIINNIILGFILKPHLTPNLNRIMFIQYIALLSSVFSAFRKLAINNNWKNKHIVEKTYFYMFIFFKFFANISTWILWIHFEMNKNYNIAVMTYKYLIIYLIGTIQLYFSYKIYKKLYKLDNTYKNTNKLMLKN